MIKAVQEYFNRIPAEDCKVVVDAESRDVMRAALQIVVAQSKDDDMRAIAQAALDIDKFGIDGCAEMRGDKPE